MSTDPHTPRRYQRTDSDDNRELNGYFRVMHIDPPRLESTLDTPVLSSVECFGPRPLRWLWPDKIPCGKLTVIEGPPAVGKLYAALDIAARVSTGELWVDDAAREPYSWERVDKERGRKGDKKKRKTEATVPVEPTPAPGDAAQADGQSQLHPIPPGPSLPREGEADPDSALRTPHSALPPAAAEVDASLPENERSQLVRWPRPGYVPPPGYVPLEPDPHPSTGRPVVVVCDEWEIEDMIRPRLESLGANLSRVATFTHVLTCDSCHGHRDTREIRFPLDETMIGFIRQKHRLARLIVIDNLENYCQTPKQMRAAIKALDRAALYHDVAIVVTVQGNIKVAKDGTLRDTARKADGVARCIWCITPDPSHPGLLRFEPKRMAFCKKPEGIAFRITDDGKVAWEPLPVYQKPPTEAARRRELKQARMLAWLSALLGTGNVVPAGKIYEEGKEEGYSRNKLIEARQELGARSIKWAFGKDGAWLWTFKPESEVTDTEMFDALAAWKLPGEPGVGTDSNRIGPPGSIRPEERRAKGEERNTRVQNGENSRTLNENGGENGDFGSKGSPGNGHKHPSQMDLDELRELGLRKLGEIARGRSGFPA